MKRKLISLLLVLAMVLSLCSLSAMAAEAVEAGSASILTFGNAMSFDGASVKGCTDPDAEEIVIPAEVDGKPVTEIDGEAFMGMKKLRSVTIPDSVELIWMRAFADCTALEQVEFQGELIALDDYCFSGCTSLKELDLPLVGGSFGYSFSGCTGLKTVALSAGQPDIGVHAFEGCTGLEAFYIPASVDLIYLSSISPNENLKIYGVKGSTADRYAQKIGVDFVPVDGASGFSDVAEDRYYAASIPWASQSGITLGYPDGTFRPDTPCTRWQMVMFLWRLYGEPEYTTVHEFEDVPKTARYYDAVQWAYENEITKGISETKFAPDRPVNRGMVVTMLWRMDGSPSDGVWGADNFTDDIPESYVQAVGWMSRHDVANGYPDGTFRSGNTCTRGQIVTFIYRNMGHLYRSANSNIEDFVN